MEELYVQLHSVFCIWEQICQGLFGANLVPLGRADIPGIFPKCYDYAEVYFLSAIFLEQYVGRGESNQESIGEE